MAWAGSSSGDITVTHMTTSRPGTIVLAASTARCALSGHLSVPVSLHSSPWKPGLSSQTYRAGGDVSCGVWESVRGPR